MRTYQKRPSTRRHCVHCHAPFESAHKRRIYCGNSCSTLAYYARKAQATPPAVTKPTSAAQLGSPPVGAAADPTPPPAVTLAVNAQNLALLATAPLLTEGIRQVAEFVGKLLAPTSQDGPSTWLPGMFRLIKEPFVTFQHVDWDEPRFFVPVPWGGTVFYYRAKQDLLFWQDPEGKCYQLTKKTEFDELLQRLRSQKLAQERAAEITTSLTRGLTLPPSPLKDLG
jgi:hypothetical protein